MRCKDHLENEYKSVSEMCKHYGITRQTFYHRIADNYSLEEALCTPVPDYVNNMDKIQVSHIVYDHLGNEYKSITEMCRAYNIDNFLYYTRIKSGLSVEDALTSSKGVVYDHLGNAYKSKSEMCKAYGICLSTLNNRLRLGLKLEQALTLKKSSPSTKTCKDHLGNTYKSIKSMLEVYGISYPLYKTRKRLGWSLEKILMTPLNSKPRKAVKNTSNVVYDHLGNEYKSEYAMCKFYGVTQHCFQSRLKAGYMVEEALTGLWSKGQKNGKFCKDHLGNEYRSIRAMCDTYNTLPGTYHRRLKNGCSLEEALTGKVRKFK